MPLSIVYTIEILLFLAIVVILFYACVLVTRIGYENETKRRDQIQLQTQNLLALMAKAMGVDDDKIEECIYKKKL